MDGLELLRHDPAVGSRTPLVLMSGYSREASAERILECGASGFIQKPFEPPKLAEVVNENVRKSGEFASALTE